jgi:hypothetical protein
MKTRLVGAFSNARSGIFKVDAKTDVEPAATHSLKFTVVNSA